MMLAGGPLAAAGGLINHRSAAYRGDAYRSA
jgi:hypothetical protein